VRTVLIDAYICGCHNNNALVNNTSKRRAALTFVEKWERDFDKEIKMKTLQDNKTGFGAWSSVHVTSLGGQKKVCFLIDNYNLFSMDQIELTKEASYCRKLSYYQKN